VIRILKYRHSGSSFHLSRNDGSGKNGPIAGVSYRLNWDGENWSWEQDQYGSPLYGSPRTRIRIVHDCFAQKLLCRKAVKNLRTELRWCHGRSPPHRGSPHGAGPAAGSF